MTSTRLQFSFVRMRCGCTQFEVVPLPDFLRFRLRLKAQRCCISSFVSTGRRGGPARTANANEIAGRSDGRADARWNACGRRMAPVRTALFSQLGHKGDLILVHFRDSFEALNQVELDLAQTRALRLSRADAFVCVGGGAGPVRVEPQDL